MPRFKLQWLDYSPSLASQFRYVCIALQSLLWDPENNDGAGAALFQKSVSELPASCTHFWWACYPGAWKHNLAFIKAVIADLRNYRRGGLNLSHMLILTGKGEAVPTYKSDLCFFKIVSFLSLAQVSSGWLCVNIYLIPICPKCVNVNQYGCWTEWVVQGLIKGKYNATLCFPDMSSKSLGVCETIYGNFYYRLYLFSKISRGLVSTAFKAGS